MDNGGKDSLCTQLGDIVTTILPQTMVERQTSKIIEIKMWVPPLELGITNRLPGVFYL